VRRWEPPHSPAWGWLETVILSLTLFPALLFIPGLAKVRTATRVVAYAITLVAWFFVSQRDRANPAADTFPARPWLVFSMVWLSLSIFHPSAHTLLSASAQAALYVTIFCPAFWGPSALDARRQLPRILAILFLCNALSAAVGVAQVFRPATFMPPDMPALRNEYGGQNLVYETADGRTIFRPTGLTDTPGGASIAGVTAAVLGFCWALRPVAFWKRLAGLGFGFLGVAVIYFTHVRVALIMLALSLAAQVGLFVLQRNFRQAALLAGGGAAALLGALLWAIRSVGGAVADRFLTLFQGDPVTLFEQNRGGFVRHAFEHLLWEAPLGAGMGWWGMTHQYFGDLRINTDVWCELMWQAWLQDGGIPLLVGYTGAIAAALWDTARIALTCPDREVAYWGGVVCSLNLALVAGCFCFIPFLSPMGIQFWLLAAAVHAAAALSVLPDGRRRSLS
jgi:hypothetical protein